jgi:hypothetical protein
MKEVIMNKEIPDFGVHYTAIGQSLVDLLPMGFKVAWAGIERDSADDAWSVDIFYLKENGRYGLYQGDLREINKVTAGFVGLEKDYKKAGLAPWTTATFRLTDEGKMTLDLGYEDVSDYDLAPTRRDAWIKKYLGDVSLIDWSD